MNRPHGRSVSLRRKCSQHFYTSPSLLPLLLSFLSFPFFCLFKEHVACSSLSGYHSTKSGRPPARGSRYVVSEHLAEKPEHPCDGVSGCLVTISFWVSSIISQPPSSWTGSLENTRMFVLEAPVIAFNPKAFFFFFLYDELFRQCFPKLSSIRTDPERMCVTTPMWALRGIGVFWLHDVPEERIQSQGLSFSGQ